MKTCPKCEANVEGLLHRCDFCGASLEPKPKRLFTCAVYELPQCFHFSSLVYKMMDAIQPPDPAQYEAFLQEVGIGMVCYPESMLMDGNIKDNVRYYTSRKHASLWVTVDYRQYIGADEGEKAHLIAAALYKGLGLLEARLIKAGHNVQPLMQHAYSALVPYILTEPQSFHTSE